MKIFSDKKMLAAGLVGGTLSRHTGPMGTPQDQQKIYDELRIPSTRILHFKQTHSARLIELTNQDDITAFTQLPTQEADAWLFAPAQTGWGCAVITADCVPLFLWTATGDAFALAHCGWRGVVQQLPLLTAQALRRRTNEPIYAYLGPHIQSCCFEVQADCAEQFSPKNVLHKNGKLYVDLTGEITDQLKRAGLTQENINAPYYCTCGDRENFFSWRRDKARNMLLSFIYKP